jgi:hypothetical protein
VAPLMRRDGATLKGERLRTHVRGRREEPGDQLINHAGWKHIGHRLWTRVPKQIDMWNGINYEVDDTMTMVVETNTTGTAEIRSLPRSRDKRR